MIWIVFALLTGAAVMAVLAPLAMRGTEPDAKAADIAFFEAQLAEIDRDAAAGRLDPAEAAAARAEAGRRLLRVEAALEAPASHGPGATRIAALGAVLAIPALAVGLYLHLGSASLPDFPLQARLDAEPAAGDLAGAVARIERHLHEHPDDGRGWEVVAPYFLRTGRAQDAVQAYTEALRLLGPTADRRAALGEARLIAAQGKMTPAAQAEFEAALAMDSGHVTSQFYLGAAAAEAGETEKALGYFERLAAGAPADAPWLGPVKAQIARLRGAPADAAPTAGEASGPASAQGQAIAALPEKERAGVIRSMVERLATRLETNGDDIEGWLKLIRAYSVLAETEKAKKALVDARRAMAGKNDAIARLEALAKQLGIGG
jgi:cytochrome c-type biogenesis protein CcmH